ncbi:MAG: Smr/MutS family protein [Deltaproteobacteria bacterium]|nr:Smr/MutS family protein [Deltaproteobacteria bacterium]
MDDYKRRLKELKEKLRDEKLVQNTDKLKKGESKELEPSLSDEEFFLKEMEGVKRLAKANRIPVKSRAKIPQHYSEDEEALHVLNMLIDGDIEFRISDTADYIEGYNVKDYDPNILKKLKRGEIAYQDYLDLHGKTKDEAKNLIKGFIEQARKFGNRCVLIIHGKGIHSKDHIPVLKESLKNWFSNKSIGRHILAFCSAIPRDGGTGAIYVLLRR